MSELNQETWAAFSWILSTFELIFKAIILLLNTENLEMCVFEMMRYKLGCINSDSSWLCHISSVTLGK